MKEYRLGVIGFGHMSTAIIKGALNAGVIKADEILIYDPSAPRIQEAQRMGLQAAETAAETAEACRYVLLAVRPQNMQEVMDTLAGIPIHAVLSIVTGWSIAAMKQYLNTSSLMRIMPNTPMQVSKGAAFMAAMPGTSPETEEFTHVLLSPLGILQNVEEELINKSVTVHGSTPAYFYYLVNVLIKDAVRQGFDEETARDFITETMIGSGELLKAARTKPVQKFIDEVCSPGGTTIEAVGILRDRGLDAIVEEANGRCIARALELGKH